MRYVKAVLFGLLGAALCVGPILWFVKTTPVGTEMKIEALQSPYRTEEGFLVSRIVEDVAGMVSISAKTWDGRAQPKVTVAGEGTRAVRVSVDIGSEKNVQTLTLESVWSPEPYAPLVAELLKTRKIEAAPSTRELNDESLLSRLLDLRVDVLSEQDESLSEQLRSQPADPQLHEEAALLLGALGLREAAGDFSDVRPVLCRMTAHLAFARGLRGSSQASLSGQYADALLATLAERGAEAEQDIERLGAISASPEVREPWLRLLRMRLTDDYRLLADPARASLAERLAWFRAANHALESPAAVQMLHKAGFASVSEPDWAWIVGEHAAVDPGNEFLEAGIRQSLDEAQHVWSRKRKLVSSASWRIEALNDEAQLFASTEGPEVLAWGTWAALYQRHLFHLVERTERHLREMLALEREARQFAAGAMRRVSTLTFAPLLAACWEAEKEHPSPGPLDAAITFILRRPELITEGFWWGFEEKTLHQGSPRRLPSRSAWFATGCVRGTTYDINTRGRSLGALFNPARVHELRAISPNNYPLVYYDIWANRRGHRTPQLADAERAFGARLEYDVRALNWMAEWAEDEDPSAQVRFERRLCEVDTGRCVALGFDCVNQGDEPCAVEAYERAIKESPDRLVVAHHSPWIIDHYFRSGAPQKAKEVADMLADIGSSGAFRALARYHELAGDYAAAEKDLDDWRERYQDYDAAYYRLGFYYRMQQRNVAPYQGKFRALTKTLFPKGLEAMDLAALGSTPPTDGAIFTGESPSLRRNGLFKGDIVVACNGWRVRSSEQYATLRELDPDPQFHLVVWRKGLYVEVTARRVGHLFGVDMHSYRAAGTR